MKNSFYYSGITHYFAQILATITGSLFQINKKEQNIIDSVKQQINHLDAECLMLRSGRSCLRYLFSDITTTVLLPSYTCNVVERSADNVKKDFYHIDDCYHYCLDEILEYIKAHPRCCVLISSYLNRKSDWRYIVEKIREISQECVIVFDECQNSLNLNAEAPLVDNVYYVISFNNKMTFGYLGGMIIGKSIPHRSIEKNSCREEIHALLSFARSTICDVINAIRHQFAHPRNIEVSGCNGIYSCEIKRPLRVSVSAAYLAMRHREESLERLSKNYRTLMCNASVKSMLVEGCNETTMPFFPVAVTDQVYGRLPIKGAYGGLSEKNESRDKCIVIHNMLNLNIKER